MSSRQSTLNDFYQTANMDNSQSESNQTDEVPDTNRSFNETMLGNIGAASSENMENVRTDANDMSKKIIFCFIFVFMIMHFSPKTELKSH